MKEEDRLVESLHPLERAVLPTIKDGLDIQDIIKKSNLQEVEVVRAVQWLENKRLIRVSRSTREIISLDKNGKRYLNSNLPEKRFLQAVSQPLTLEEIKKQSSLDEDECAVAIGILKKKNLIQFSKKITRTQEGERAVQQSWPEEEFLSQLPLDASQLTPGQKKIHEELRKRKRIISTDIRKIKTIALTDLGKRVSSLDLKKDLIEALTPSILKSQEWKTKAFRRYDVAINVPAVYPAKRHMVNQALQYIRRIWLDMGFREMSGPLLEAAFWNFDALFVPQDHPAREMQDTFYVQAPMPRPIPRQMMQQVKRAHESGGATGSRGWQYAWSEKSAQQMMLITHDTYLSAKTLAATSKKDLPLKTFQIMKVFRNETMDWKHLFEFYQVGGIVVDESMNFRHLLGYLKEFFRKMGYGRVRFRPGFFPYVEPGLECEVFHPQKKKWMELGGAGIFRPEVVKPLLNIDCPVLAWGLGLERIITEYYGIQDLREIYKNDLKRLKEAKVWMK